MNVSTRINRLLLLLLPLLVLVLIGCASVIYPSFSHQGRLLDAGGSPVADGSYPIEYTLYHAASGGTAVYTQASSISTEDGYFTSAFGAADVDPKIFSEITYLEITVNGENLTPRQQLRGAPYASGLVSGVAIVGSEPITYTYSGNNNLGAALLVANTDSTATGGSGLTAITGAQPPTANIQDVAAVRGLALDRDANSSTGTYGGIFVSEDFRGIYADDGTGSAYAAYFDGDIRVIGNCSGCIMALVAQNIDDSVIEPGDFVTAAGVEVDLDYGTPVMLVRKATDGDSVIGVAGSAMERGAYHEDTLTQLGFDLASGLVQPGGYVSIVMEGLVQARLSSDTSLKTGDYVAFGAAGLSTVANVSDSVAQVMSEADESGLQWVLLNR